MSDIILYNGDCLEEMKKIEEESVQLILTDLPYNTTPCEWDKNPINLDILWEHFKRVLKPNGAVVLFSQQPFTSKLILSNLEMYKYNWIWRKNKFANFLNVKYQPGKITEDICVFAKMASAPSKKGNMKYNPQMLEGKPYKNKGLSNRSTTSVLRSAIKKKPIDNKGERYPTNILEFSLDTLNDFDKEFPHPTRKPINLLRHLIKTYTDENDLILDATMGVCSTGVSALLENRKFIGIEKDTDYFNKACQRIDKYKALTENK